MRERAVTFPGALGHEISARLALPADGKVLACALFVHCFNSSEDLEPARHISRALTQSGIGVLRFDFTGRGGSENGRDETSHPSSSQDVIAAAAYMEREIQGPAILVGHSIAGAAVLVAAGHIASCRAVATIGAPYDLTGLDGLFGGTLPDPDAKGDVEALLGGRRFAVSRQLLKDLDSRRMNEILAGLDRALLLFHSPVDEVIDVDNAAKLYTAAPHPKSFVSLDDADHLLTDERDARYVGHVLAAWVGRYMDARPERAQDEAELIADNEVSATTGQDGYVTEILARGHALVADEPAAVGGSDLGPTPYDLLAAALGACTTMTLRMYAARKDWPLEEATVRLRHRKIHARDEEACEHRDARLDALEREITLEGPLDDEQRIRLMQIADRCPVHRTLSAGVVIETRGSH